MEILNTVFQNEEEEDYYTLVGVSNFWSNNYIKYKSNSDINKTLSVEEYLNNIRPYLRDINNLQKSDTCEIQLIKAINFISAKDNDEERVIHSKIDNIEIMINHKADKVMEELFNHLLRDTKLDWKHQ